ncbi:hypothetical protein [Pedobacter nutrimenti]|uniref:hypothetical protein n=1 Tax=Pedobacter nutrimenti TaxID=1241337 RepID=UPI0014750E66|nr:hypothetical protein [Pedobacter nutrimenti]
MKSTSIPSKRDSVSGRLIVLNYKTTTTMKSFTTNVKIVLNFFPYLIKKIYFKS